MQQSIRIKVGELGKAKDFSVPLYILLSSASCLFLTTQTYTNFAEMYKPTSKIKS